MDGITVVHQWRNHSMDLANPPSLVTIRYKQQGGNNSPGKNKSHTYKHVSVSNRVTGDTLPKKATGLGRRKNKHLVSLVMK